MVDYDKIDEFAGKSVAAAYDTCHKIYLIGDNTELEKMRGYGYEEIITLGNTVTPYEIAEEVKAWYHGSCGLRFVYFVNTNADGDTEFQTVIGQFEDEDPEDEEK